MAITPELPTGEAAPPSARVAPLSWMDLVHHPLLALDAEGRNVVSANAAARALFHLPEGGPAALSRLDALLGDWAAARLGAHVRFRQPGDRLLLPTDRAAGAQILAVRHAPLPGADAGYLLTLEPAAEHLQGEARGWAGLSQDVLAGLPVGLKIFDLDFNQLFSNAVSNDMFAPPAQGGRFHLEDWWAQAFPEAEARNRAIAEWRHRLSLLRLQSSQFAQTDWEVRCRDGATRTIQFRFGFIGDLYVMAYWDITARRRMEEELRRLAGTDALTGLGNRRMFMERSEAAFHNAVLAGTPVCVLVFDMDRFKWINDRHGHATGDAVLREVAARCRAELRPHDVFARLGGEEFAVLISGAELPVAERVAHRLARAISTAPIETPAAMLEVRASFGVAGLTPEDANLEAVVERADRALYLAKARGRNQVVVADGTDAG